MTNGMIPFDESHLTPEENAELEAARAALRSANAKLTIILIQQEMSHARIHHLLGTLHHMRAMGGTKDMSVGDLDREIEELQALIRKGDNDAD